MTYAEKYADVVAQMNMPQDRRDIIERTKADSAKQAHGLRAGMAAPDFCLSNQDGQQITLSEQLIHGPVVLAFFRGSWCTFCSLQMKAWTESIGDILVTGATAFAIHPESIAISKSFHAELGLQFDLLADLDQSVIKAYGLQFRVHPDYEAQCRSRDFLVSDYNADSSWNLPVPGTFLIGTDGQITTAWVDHDYWNRTEVADVVAAIEAL